MNLSYIFRMNLDSDVICLSISSNNKYIGAGLWNGNLAVIDIENQSLNYLI